MNSSFKVKQHLLRYTKLYSYDSDGGKLIAMMLSKIVGSGGLMTQVYRTRKMWSIKRSPHIFSKSQESFGYEVFVSYLTFKSDTSSGSRWPINYYDIMNCLRHIVPGKFWSFFSKL